MQLELNLHIFRLGIGLLLKKSLECEFEVNANKECKIYLNKKSFLNTNAGPSAKER